MSIKISTESVATSLQTSITSALAAIPLGGSPEDAYKAFMDKLGEGFTKTLADALGAAVGALDSQVATAGSNPNLQLIIDLISKGPSLSLSFPTPLTAGYTQRTTVQSGMISGGAATPSPAVAPLGGSISVGGNYSF